MASAMAALRVPDENLESRADCLSEAARDVPNLSLRERAELHADALHFLRHDVGEHLLLDEQVLFPTIASRLGDPLAVAPMSYEHGAIRWWIDELAAVDLADADALQRLLYEVHGLLKLHLSREEDLYVGALDSPTWPAGT